MAPSSAKNIPRWFAPILVGLLGQAFMGRNDLPWTLAPGLILLVFSVLWLQRLMPSSPSRPEKETGRAREWTLATLIFFIALFFRWYRLDLIPAGVYLDAGGLALGSERILREGWHPFYEVYNLPITEQVYCYPLAGWFGLWGASRLSLFSFSAFISLLALPLSYWAFRQLGGTRTALAAVTVMAVSRWYLTFSRCAHPAFEAPFFLGGAMAFWLWAVQSDRWWSWVASLAFLSAGFYGYRIFYAAPFLFVTWAVYEGWQRRDKERRTWIERCFWYFSGLLFFTAPVWLYRLLGRRYAYWTTLDRWFPERLKTEGWGVFVSHLRNFALMFHRQADTWPVHNWSDHRVLDLVTGLLFLFGLFAAFRKWRERSSFYPLSGLIVMSLPSLLAAADAPVNRAIGMFPFVAFLTGRAWESIRFETEPGKRIGWGRIWTAIPFLLLAAIAADNFYTYFYLQSRQPGVCQAHWTDATVVGEKLAVAPEDNIYLSPRFYRNWDVDFLAFNKRRAFQLLSPWGLSNGSNSFGKSMVFALDEGKIGVLQLLQKKYPAGSLETYEYFKGWPLVYFYHVPAGSPTKGGPWGGLQGVYWSSDDWKGPPVLARIDPFLNFTFRDDFGLGDFTTLSAQWVGFLVAPEMGDYSFAVLTTDESVVWVDGQKVLQGLGTQVGTIFLKSGRHHIHIDFRKSSGVDTAFNLLWKVPGGQNYQIVPFWQWASSAKPTVPIQKP